MKSMWPSSVANFFMTYFYRAGGGGMAPSAPHPGSSTAVLQFGRNSIGWNEERLWSQMQKVLWNTLFKEYSFSKNIGKNPNPTNKKACYKATNHYLLFPDFDSYGKCLTSLKQRVAMEKCSRDFAVDQLNGLHEYWISPNGTNNLHEVVEATCRYLCT